MKTTHLLLFLFFSLPVATIAQQPLIPLFIDSLYRAEIDEVSFDGNHTYDIFFAGYTYDDENVLQQVREPKRRIHYNYGGDSVVTEVMEKRLLNGDWVNERRKKHVYDDTLLISTLVAAWENDTWVNNTYDNYFYNENGLDTLKLVFKWVDNAWKNSIRRERIYSPMGNLSATSFYTANTSGAFEYFYGLVYMYDNAGNRLQETFLVTSPTGIIPSYENTWSYDDQNRVDTFHHCTFFDGLCEPEERQTYEYLADTILRRYYDWVNEEWSFQAIDFFFQGPWVYSYDPDSILTYQYDFELGAQELVQQEYYSFEELPDNRLYFQHRVEALDPNFGIWVQTFWEERWYHYEAPITSLSSSPAPTPGFLVFPNPVQAGAPLHFRSPAEGTDAYRIRLFDLSGRVLQEQLLTQGAQGQLQAPTQAGAYFAGIFSEKNELLYLTKILVQ